MAGGNAHITVDVYAARLGDALIGWCSSSSEVEAC